MSADLDPGIGTVNTQVPSKRIRDDRVEKLSVLLKEHQELIYRQEHVAKFFPNDSDTQRVATLAWEQIHSQVGGAIQENYSRVLEKFQVMDKLSQLDVLERTNESTAPAWRPSGNPTEDFTQAAGAVLRISAIPEFEKLYEEVQSVTSRLQDLMKEKQAELAALEMQITSKLEQLAAETADLQAEDH